MWDKYSAAWGTHVHMCGAPRGVKVVARRGAVQEWEKKNVGWMDGARREQ